MGNLRLLPGERTEATLRPHPIGFASRFFAAMLPALYAVFLWWLAGTAWWATGGAGKWYQVWTWAYGNAYALYVYAFVGMVLLGIVVGIAAIRMLFALYFAITALVAIGLTVWLARGGADAQAVLPILLAVMAVPGLLWVEASRRSHRYVLTNLRIVFRGGLAVTKERQMRYESITDLDGTQGPLGRLFDVGTLIPVTQSGFGLGDDQAGAGVGAAAGGKKGGIGAGIGGMAGGSRGLNVGRARSFHQLTGVRPFKETKFLIEGLVQQATTTPYLREQVELQKQMLDALREVGQ